MKRVKKVVFITHKKLGGEAYKFPTYKKWTVSGNREREVILMEKRTENAKLSGDELALWNKIDNEEDSIDQYVIYVSMNPVQSKELVSRTEAGS